MSIPKVLLIPVICLFVTLIPGCGEDPDLTPEQTVMEYYEALLLHDYDKAESYTHRMPVGSEIAREVSVRKKKSDIRGLLNYVSASTIDMNEKYAIVHLYVNLERAGAREGKGGTIYGGSNKKNWVLPMRFVNGKSVSISDMDFYLERIDDRWKITGTNP